MIEPQVVHGGASSWFWIAANGEVDGTIAPVGLTFAVGVDGAFGAGTGRLERSATPSPRRGC